MPLKSSNSIMVSLLLRSQVLDFPLDWTDKMTLFLILFSAGVLCLICAILLAVYFLNSDRFITKSSKKEEMLSYPSFEEFEEESRLSKVKSKIGAFFGRIKGGFKSAKEELEFIEPESPDFIDELPSEQSEDEPPPSNEDSELEI